MALRTVRLSHLLEEIADARGPHSDEQLDELGGGAGEEWGAGLPGHSLGEQGLSGACGSCQEGGETGEAQGERGKGEWNEQERE